MSDQQPPPSAEVDGLDEISHATAEFEDAADPFALFATWYEEAKTTEPNDPNAMALATVDQDGLPNVRMVLLKGVDRENHGS